jgi:pseudouridine kinase
MHLTDREREIVTLLRRDPTISPAAIADQLGSSRASVNVHLSNLGKKGVILGRGYLLSESPGVVVIGGANVDVKARSTAPATPETSNPGHASMTPGGVGRNIAENLARLGTRTHLVSVVGRDPLGDTLLSQTAASGVHLEHVTRTDATTGTYTAVLDANGELIIAVAAMAAIDELGPERVDAARDLIATAELVVVDGNVRLDAMEHALELAAAAHVRAIVEPVSVPKARALSPCLTPERPLFAITPNRDELAALTGLPTGTDRQVARAAARLHDRGVELVWVRLGDRGSVLSRPGAEPVAVPAVLTEVEDVSGAGDAALAAFCHALLSGEEPESAARFGHAAASLTIASTHTVRPDLTERLVRSTLKSLA